MPWIILDFKGDELINGIERANHISYDDKIGKTGIHILHPLPNETEQVENFMWQMWQRERIGIYADEGYMLGNNPAFEACLTQGRSKNIPMIVLSQRPAWISRFVFSEGDFFQVFHLNDKRDRKAVESFMPPNFGVRLPPFHSHYYDVGRDALYSLSPVPGAQEILDAIDAKISPRRKFL
jgi:hypothetical protein